MTTKNDLDQFSIFFLNLSGSNGWKYTGVITKLQYKFFDTKKNLKQISSCPGFYFG